MNTVQNNVTNIERLTEAELNGLLQIVQPKGGRILDVQAGAAQVACAFAPYVDTIIATESSQDMLTIAQESVAEVGCKNIDLISTSEDTLQFPENYFDGLIARSIVHQFLDMQVFLQDVFRVLKPGGWLLIEEAVSTGDKESDTLLNETERLRDPLHVAYYSKKTWENRLQKIGFNIEHNEVNSKPYNLNAWLAMTEVPESNKTKYSNIIQNSTSWLREYLRPHGEEETLTFHLHRITLLAKK